MTWKQAFTSSIGRKLTMSLTGIFLLSFLAVHVSLNACIWNATGAKSDHGKLFNEAADFMGTNVIIRTLEIGLFIFFIIHIVQGLLLAATNLSKRDVPYAKSFGSRGSTWYSRSMGLLGTLILLFLIVHLSNFWFPSRWHQVPEFKPIADEHVANLFGLMQTTFTNPVIDIIYVIGCISLAYHLAHGFQSAFRTLGVHNKRYQAMLRNIGIGYSIIVCLAFAMMPVSFYFGWVN
jgi:succinate dehydrogenase / fumarate reductase cytochrome b subunit